MSFHSHIHFLLLPDYLSISTHLISSYCNLVFEIRIPLKKKSIIQREKDREMGVLEIRISMKKKSNTETEREREMEERWMSEKRRATHKEKGRERLTWSHLRGAP
jgi:hypothetical protein